MFHGNPLPSVLAAGILTIGLWLLFGWLFDHIYYNAVLYVAVFAIGGEIIDTLHKYFY